MHQFSVRVTSVVADDCIEALCCYAGGRGGAAQVIYTLRWCVVVSDEVINGHINGHSL